jgi:hypothetical protein|tara:strand:+ start:219 stop:344 length:126 start_codon:yes stop_codon:yes gene_type:complete
MNKEEEDIEACKQAIKLNPMMQRLVMILVLPITKQACIKRQ